MTNDMLRMIDHQILFFGIKITVWGNLRTFA